MLALDLWQKRTSHPHTVAGTLEQPRRSPQCDSCFHFLRCCSSKLQTHVLAKLVLNIYFSLAINPVLRTLVFSKDIAFLNIAKPFLRHNLLCLLTDALRSSWVFVEQYGI